MMQYSFPLPPKVVQKNKRNLAMVCLMMQFPRGNCTLGNEEFKSGHQYHLAGNKNGNGTAQ